MQDPKKKKPVKIDSTIKSKWQSPELTQWNKGAAKRDSIANVRLAQKDSLLMSRIKKK